MAGNPFSARASFQVQDPNVPASNLLNAAINLEQTNRRNFQQGLNNAIQQAASLQRQKQSDEAQMAREIQREDFARQQQAASQAFERQNQLEQQKLAQGRQASDINAAIQFERNSLQQSKDLFQHKNNLVAKKADIIDRANQADNLGSEGVQNVLDLFDKEIQAADVALGLNEQRRAEITAGVSGINGQDPAAGQAAFESAATQAFPGELLADEQAGLSPITEEIGLEQAIDPSIQGRADSLKLTFEAKQAETAANLAEESAKAQPPRVISEEETRQTAREILGQEPTNEEVKFFKELDEQRDQRTKGTKATKTKYINDGATYNENTGSLFDVDQNAANLSDAVKFAKSRGVEIDINAQSALRALTDKVIDSDDNEGAQELLNEMRAVNIFKFPKDFPEDQKQAIENQYLTALDQITGSSSFIARGAGNTGVLTAKDVQFAMKRYISLNGGMDQFIDNLEKGRASTAASQMRGGYLYQNELATKGWKDKLDSLGYEISEQGSAIKKDVPLSLFERFDTPSEVTEESDIFKSAPKSTQNALKLLRQFKQRRSQ